MVNRVSRRLALVLATGFSLLFSLAGGRTAPAAPPVDVQPKRGEPRKPVRKPLQWLTAMPLAQVNARKTNRLILAYFSGSDWCEWCKKLDAEVLSTDMFREWAEQNVVLLNVDYPRDKHQAGLLKDQAEKLKTQYNIAKTPTLLFLDSEGEVVSRCGYDTARLRDDEETGKPAAWIKFADDVIKNRPPDEALIEQKGLAEGMAYSKKHFIPLLVLITQGTSPHTATVEQELTSSQSFIRFVNRNMAFARAHWPEDSDLAAPAKAFRAFVDKQKIATNQYQLVVWDFQIDKVQGRFAGFPTQPMGPLIARLTKELPQVDYSGGWLSDFRQGQAIAAQKQKPLFIVFTSMDSSDWCLRMDEEIFNTDEFKAYARKNLILLKVDYPTDPKTIAAQSDALKQQNKMMADMFGIRGFPSVIVLNPINQRIGDAKYQKGGPAPFLKDLDLMIKKDTERRHPFDDILAK